MSIAVSTGVKKSSWIATNYRGSVFLSDLWLGVTTMTAKLLTRLVEVQGSAGGRVLALQFYKGTSRIATIHGRACRFQMLHREQDRFDNFGMPVG